MAWPFDNTPISTPPIDLSGLGSYGSPAAPVNSMGTAIAPQVNTATNAAGGFSPMEMFKGLFNQKAMFGGTEVQNGVPMQSMGWAMPALGLASGVMGMMANNKQMGIAKDQLKEARRQFDLNYGAQRQSMNTELEDRQRARVASNAGGYQPVDEYMNKNRIR